MFDDLFFKQFPQNPSSFIDDGGQQRNYDFPSLYDSCRGMMGIFTCSWKKAQDLLPACSLIAAPGGIGRALVAVGAFEYLNPKGMDPYNEVLFGIPALLIRPGLKTPVLGISVQQLIVDQPENVQRGKHLWGMNKSLGDLGFFDHGDLRVCEVHRNGRRALRFEVPKKGVGRTYQESRTLFSVKDGQLLSSRTSQAGRKVDSRSGAALIHGADPFSAELRSLEIADAPLRASCLVSYRQAMSLPLELQPIAV